MLAPICKHTVAHVHAEALASPLSYVMPDRSSSPICVQRVELTGEGTTLRLATCCAVLCLLQLSYCPPSAFLLFSRYAPIVSQH